MMEERITRIFQKIELDKGFKNMFFKKLSETENPYRWFEELRKRGYLDPKNNKNPVLEENNYTIPYWEALGFLENLAKRLFENPDEILFKKLLGLINSIINHKKENKRIENPHTDWMVIKTIFNLPVERITLKHVHFIETALLSNYSNSILLSAEIEKTILPHLIKYKNKSLLLKLLEIIIKPKQKKTILNIEKTSIMDEYWFSEALKKNRAKIVEICGLKTADIIIHQMDLILKEKKNSFSIVFIPTIEDNAQTMFPDKYENQLVYLLRETLEQVTPPLQQNVLVKLLQSQFPIFKRIGIHIINFHYTPFGNLFWSWKKNPFEKYGLKHEIYELLKSNHQSFSEKEYDILTKWIEGIKYRRSDKRKETDTDVQKIEAQAKLEYLTAVSETNNKKIKAIHKKYVKIFPYKIENPGYIIWSSGVQVSSVAETTIFSKEILDKTNQDIVEYIKNYKKPKEKKMFGFNQSLSYSFNRTVRENSGKFSTDMTPFLVLEYKYQEALLSGLLEAWNNEEKFSWNELIDYITKLMGKVDFWARNGKKDDQHKNLIIGNIADLIYNGTNNDKHAYEAKYFLKTEEILLTLGEKTKSEIGQDSQDIFTKVLNSSLGKVYSAMISYSLRIARLQRKDKEQKWVKVIKSYFEKTLEMKRSVEFDVTLGNFLLQLDYLDKKWVNNKINNIFPRENTKSWINAFSSYLFHSSHFSDELYLLLKSKQHYDLALETDFKESEISMKLTQHIFIAYVRGIETLSKNSLVDKLIKNSNTRFLSDLILFAWRFRKKNEKIKSKIKPLWGKIVDFIRSSEDDSEYKEILVNLFFWLSLIDEIDNDIYDWLKTSIKYVNAKIEIFLAEYLLQHVDKTPKLVAEIFYEIVGVGKYFPRFKQKDIVILIEKLFTYKQSEKARRICNLYLQNGYDFLRDIQEKNKDV